MNAPPASTPLKSQLTPQEQAALAALGSPISVARQRLLYEEGEACHHAYTVEDGLIMLERLSSDGRRQVLAFVYPGDFIGIDVSGTHLVTATALKDSQLTRYPIRKLDDLARAEPGIDRALRQVTNRILAYALDQVCVLGRLTARQRLMYFLIHLLRRQGGSPDLIVDVPMNRQDVADFLGLTVETVSRSLSALKRDGIVMSPRPHKLKILDMEAALDMLELSEPVT